MILDQYSGFYFFSSLFQGNIAFLALAGVFTVYRLQLLSQIIHSKEGEIVGFVSGPFEGYMNKVPDEVLTALKDFQNLQASLLTYHNNLTETQHWKNIPLVLSKDSRLTVLIRQWIHVTTIREHISTQAKVPFVWIIAIVLLSLVGLPLASIIHSAGPTAEIIIIGAMVALNGAAIIINSAFSLRLLRDTASSD